MSRKSPFVLKFTRILCPTRNHDQFAKMLKFEVICDNKLLNCVYIFKKTKYKVNRDKCKYHAKKIRENPDLAYQEFGQSLSLDNLDQFETKLQAIVLIYNDTRLLRKPSARFTTDKIIRKSSFMLAKIPHYKNGAIRFSWCNFKGTKYSLYLPHDVLNDTTVNDLQIIYSFSDASKRKVNAKKMTIFQCLETIVGKDWLIMEDEYVQATNSMMIDMTDDQIVKQLFGDCGYNIACVSEGYLQRQFNSLAKKSIFVILKEGTDEISMSDLVTFTDHDTIKTCKSCLYQSKDLLRHEASIHETELKYKHTSVGQNQPMCDILAKEKYFNTAMDAHNGQALYIYIQTYVDEEKQEYPAVACMYGSIGSSQSETIERMFDTNVVPSLVKELDILLKDHRSSVFTTASPKCHAALSQGEFYIFSIIWTVISDCNLYKTLNRLILLQNQIQTS